MPGQQLVLIVTAACNLRCTYCYQNARKPLSMAWEALRAAIDLGFEVAPQELNICFIGGEPLLEWPMLARAVEYARRTQPSGKRIGFYISTNGLLLTEHVARFLDEQEFEVQLSFDGIAEAQDYRQAGSFTILDRLLETLSCQHPQLFRQRLRIVATQIPSTVPYLAASFRYFINKGIRELGMSPSITPPERMPEGTAEELDAQFTEIYKESWRHLEKTGEVPLVLFRRERQKSTSVKGECAAARGEILAVDVDGEAYGCALFAESCREFAPGSMSNRLKSLRMGSVHHGCRGVANYVEVAMKSGLFGDRKLGYSSYGKCADCGYVDSCHVCPMAVEYDSTGLHRIPDFICAFNRTSLRFRALFPPVGVAAQLGE